MKGIIAYFIRYEILVNLGILLFIVFGIMSALNLTSSFFPERDTEFIIVEAEYPGASPEEIEEGITLKVEDNLKGIPGIDRVTSVSGENLATIQVELLPGADDNEVLQEVKNAVDRVSTFPPAMERIVVYKEEQVNFTAKIAITGDVPLANLKQKARDVEYDLRLMDNISQIELSGFTDEEIEIAVNENTLRTYNLTFEDIAQAVSGENIYVTGGRIRGKEREMIIRADSRNYFAEELENIIIRAGPEGQALRLWQVAKLQDTFSEETDRAFLNDQPAVMITINTTNEENILEAAADIRNYVEEFNRRENAVKAVLVDDATTSLRERISLLQENGIIGLLLVLGLLGIFLRPRLAFWVALGIPVAFLGMFIFALFYGLTINVLSLFGMILVVGILVDDGVVVGENIFQHYEAGKKPIPAAIDGTLEVLPSILSAITTTSVAFAFFFLIEGRIGEFYSDVSFVVIASLLISLIEVLLFLPAHLAHSKDLRRDYKPNKIKEKIANGMFWLRDKFYLPVLHFVLKNPVFYVLLAISMLVITLAAIRGQVVQTSFFPVVEQNTVNVTLEMPAGTSETVTLAQLRRIQAAALAVNEDYRQQMAGEEVPDVIQKVEMLLGPAPNEGRLSIYLSEAETRDVPSFTLAADIRRKAGPIPANTLSYETESPFGKPVSVSLAGRDFDAIRSAGRELRAALENIPALEDITDTDQEDQPEINLRLRPFARQLGLNLQEVITQVRSGFFGREAQRLQRGEDEVTVWVRYDLDGRRSVEDLREMRIRTAQDEEFPLKEIADVEMQRGLIAINHLDGQREVRVEADLASLDVSAPEVTEQIQQTILPDIMSRYPNVNVSFEGQMRESRRIFSSLRRAGIPILIIMASMLVITFRSFSQALALLLVIPFGVVGAVWGHAIHGLPVSLLSMLGFIALVGILVNDGLVFVNAFNNELRKGRKFRESLVNTGNSRFRPLVLTTITTSVGLAPLILEQSLQAQFLIPMAVTVAYGLLLGSFFIATLLPVFLTATNGAKVYAAWLWTGRKPERESVERAVREVKNEEKYE